MRTFLDIAARNERDHEEKLALRDEQVRLKDAYCCELEDVIRHDSARHAIAVEMIAFRYELSLDDAAKLIEDEYEARQAARKALAT